MRTKNSDNGPSTEPRCQLFDIGNITEHLCLRSTIYQYLNRFKRFMKRRYRYVVNMFSEYVSICSVRGNDAHMVATVSELRSGDIVRVKSRDEIQRSLNRWNQLKKCSFMEEMWRYCGTTQRVLKKVDKFLDERDYRLKKCSGLYTLEGVLCHGTIDFGECDRSCFFFWREEWLEIIEESRQQTSC